MKNFNYFMAESQSASLTKKASKATPKGDGKKPAPAAAQGGKPTKQLPKKEKPEAQKGTAHVPSDAKPKVAIDGFLDKVWSCRTAEGCDELEKFYNQRKKEVEITAAEDIQIRDALRGRRDEIKAEIEAAKAAQEPEQL